MSIQIRKYEGGEIFDLPADYVIEAAKNNPLFENRGSQTVPISFPATVKNNRLLHFPFRQDKTFRQDDTMEVLVETGSFQQRGLLSVHSASKQTVSANVGYDESTMYAVMKDMQLKDMSILEKEDFTEKFGGNNTDEKINSMLAHLTSVMKQQTERDYQVFPILINRYETDDGSFQMWEALNGINDGYIYPTGVPAGELLALENRTVTRVEGNEVIKIHAPKGYGVSPFLKVWRILEIIFLQFDFTVDENPFKTHRQLKKLVALNNTVDAILTGELHYKDLMPDVSILEFLDGLFAKFGMIYFVNSNTKTISIQFLKDLFDLKLGSNDWTRYRCEELSSAFSSPKQLRLKMNRELENAKVLYDTFEEFLKKFDYQFNNEFEKATVGTQIFQAMHSLYKVDNIFKFFSNKLNESFMYSSDFFDWDKKTPGIPYEDIEMKDLCLPLPDYHAYQILPEYRVGIKHAYSELAVGGEIQEEKNSPAKLAFIFCWGMKQATRTSYCFASQFNRDPGGHFMQDENGKQYDISLTCNRVDGLYNRFWKEYDAFLRHSNQEVIGKFHFPEIELSNLKMHRPVFVDHQPYFIKQIKYKFNSKDSVSDVVLRTIRLFKPFDLEEEQAIPEYRNQQYDWAWSETETHPTPSSQIQKTTYIYDRNYFIVNGIQIPITYLSFLPPTQEQFVAGEQRIYKYARIYSMKDGSSDIRSEVTVTFYPASIN